MSQRTREIEIVEADGPAAIAAARRLFLDYQAEIGVDLCFQDFATEVDSLPGAYGPPDGCLLLAGTAGSFLGCVALRALEPGVAELKRLFVAPQARGLGLGRRLAEAALDQARRRRFRAVRLDSLDSMAAAHALYHTLGFVDFRPEETGPGPRRVFLERRLA